MVKEIMSSTDTIETSRSFDDKHELAYNDKTHRYKLNGKAVSGWTTVLKASYPTNVGLMNWMKTEAMKSLFHSIALPKLESMNYIPRPDVWPISDEFLIGLLKLNRDTHEAVAQEAADVGTVTHSFAELWSLGKVKEATDLTEKVKGTEKWPIIESCIHKFLDWDARNKGELISAEGLVASPDIMVCGKFDRLDKVNGKLRLRDYKTSKSIYPEQFTQLGGYKKSIKDWLGLEVEELEVLRFGKDDGSFETLLIDDPKEIQMFVDQAIRCRQTFEFKKIENDVRFDWKKKQATKG